MIVNIWLIFNIRLSVLIVLLKTLHDYYHHVPTYVNYIMITILAIRRTNKELASRFFLNQRVIF